MADFVPVAPAAAVPGNGGVGDRSVAVSAVRAEQSRRTEVQRWQAASVTFPKAASVMVDLPVQASGGRLGTATVGGLPVTVSSVELPSDVLSGRAVSGRAAGQGAPSRVRVEVVDRAAAARAGATVALRLSRADGLSGEARVRVQVGYGDFRDAFGADWANRLGVVLLADCAATTPEKDACKSRSRLASVHDASTSTVSADVDLMAAPAGTGGEPLVEPSPVEASPATVGLPSVQVAGADSPIAQPPSPPSDPEPVPPAGAGPASATAGADDGAVMVALVAGASSETGTFAATQLSQTASWQAGGSAGGFSWSYPVTVPSVPGGLTPSVSLGYSSAAVDGQTANNNTQPGWIGEGFGYEPGFIERSYRPCDEDTNVTPYWPTTASMKDLCWRLPNARLMWNGKSTELVPDDASGSPHVATPKVWHLADDDSTKVEYVSDNGTGITGYWNNERWKLTTKDGTQYWFGMSAVPGSGAATSSVLGLAVMGNHRYEPCFSAAAVTSSWCRIAYRWNLDYVVDPHGNAMSYHYNRETNGQRIFNSDASFVGYYRASTLARIEYGLRAGAPETVPASARVVFTSSDRCWENCSSHGSNWPDVPWDLECTAYPCDGPTFWSTKRLTRIDTQVRSGSSYRTIDSHALNSTAPGTGHAGVVGVLALMSIQRTGSDSGTGVTGGNITTPAVQFDYGASMQNRALFETGSGAAESWKFRLRQIDTEAGGQIKIGYSGADPACVGAQTTPNPDSNPRRCFPQEYQGSWTWWHKYVVTQVIEHDTRGGAPDVVRGYSYNITLDGLRGGGGSIGSNTSVLWRHDLNAFATGLAHRTWSQWAGYPLVTETVGSGSTASKTTSLYFRGLDGDRTDLGDGTRSVTTTDTDHAPAGDAAYRGGFLKQRITFNGAAVAVKEFFDPTSTRTGLRTLNASWAASAPLEAWRTHTGWRKSMTWVAATSAWRITQTRWPSYDAHGNALQEEQLGDLGTSADDACVRTTTNLNTGADLRRFDGAAGAAAQGTWLADFGGFDQAFTGGDVSGDGKTDLLARRRSDGALWVFRGNGTGGFDAGTQALTGWNMYDSLLSPGDFTSDGKSDVIARKPDGTLWLHTGNGTGGFTATGVLVGSGWDTFDKLFSVGDFSANGVGDVIARTPEGDLYLYSGNGSGGWTNGNGGTLIGTGWQGFDVITGWKDYSGDAYPDILVRGGGGLRRYPGNGAGGFLTGSADLHYGMAAGDTGGELIAVGDITGDTSRDLIARMPMYQAGTVKRQQSTAGTCADTPTFPADAVADVRYHYDQPGASSPNLDRKPSQGNITRVDNVVDHTGVTPNWTTTSEAAHDSHGRPTSAKDALGRVTTTEYTETTGLTTQIRVTNALSHTATTNLAPGRGLPVTVVDPNTRTSTAQYDSLGRLTKTWAHRPTSETPDAEYTYSLSNTAASYVTTKALGPNGTQVVSHQILDSLLRPRQTQTTAPDGKRVVTDTVYDNRGLVAKASQFYNSASGPTTTLVTAADTAIERQTRFTYDALGRQTVTATWSLNVQKWQTTTVYDGDRTATVPPTGGTTVQDLVDAHGNVVEKRQFHIHGNLTGGHDATTYTYNLRGDLTGMSDPAGNDWSYTYDLLGRQTQAVDPDAGTTTTEYHDNGLVEATTDGRNKRLHYTYDNLDRRTAVREDSATGRLMAAWTYDTVAKGQLTSATRYDTDGLAYTTSVGSYDHAYRPLSSTVTIPASTANGALAGTYSTTATYKVNGAPATASLPAVGGLPAETLTYGYLSQGLLTSMGSAQQTYLADVDYHYDGLPQRTFLGAAGKQVRLSATYDPATRRPTIAQVDTENQTTAGTWVDRYTTEYAYLNNGAISIIGGKTNGLRDQVECFRYDHLQRMTEAWTEAAWSCATPQRAGADPYWRKWTFDSVGNRTTQTDKHPGGTDTTWTYTTPAAGQPRPHAVTGVTATGPQAGTPTRAFSYDNGGNTLTRTSSTGTSQTLTWDAEGHLATLTEGGQTTSYLYDADGNRLISRAPGKTTLYLGSTELVVTPSSGGPLGTRYYDAVAVRDATGVRWTVNNHQGSGQVQIHAGTLASERRRNLPYGEERSTTPATWLGTKGFVGGTVDATGLTHLGAREYDPTLGRFISVDPLQDLADPQQWHGYAYANNSPITFSDPSGLYAFEDVDGGGLIAYDNVVSGGSGNSGGGNPSNYGANGGNGGGGDGPGKPGSTSTPEPEPFAFYVTSYYCQYGYSPGGCHITSRSDEDIARAYAAYLCHYYQECGADNAYRAGTTKTAHEIWSNVPILGIPSSMWLANDALKRGDYVGASLELVGLVPLAKGLKVAKGIKGGKATSCHKSFSGDTEVLMADGTTKSIKDVKVADFVFATDPATGEEGPREVTHVWVHEDQLVDLKVDGGDITTTEDHPFWNVTDQQWQESQNLDLGDHLYTATGKYLVISGLNWATLHHGAAYNLTVDDIHTYYVLAGANPVLVHNTGPGECIPGYENPGHHDPHGGPNPYNPNKGVLPADAAEQFQNSVLVGEVRWTKIGSGKKAVYYRYSNDEHGNWHWSGSSNGRDNRGNPVEIPLNHIPIQVRRR
ncbi:polymorphic toxin-type HINT domain-containing protein [Micromonospora sp. NPDC023956]|uniref:polymorphic toxin-type HINT domain-containing protein n=1 Tax=Micromonospora sp. NPDC023956 TaxID=3155722 RepID=UPI0033F0457C